MSEENRRKRLEEYLGTKDPKQFEAGVKKLLQDREKSLVEARRLAPNKK